MLMEVAELAQRDEPGVDLMRLSAGTKLIVNTKNSTYLLMVTGKPGEVYARGGKKIPKATKVIFNGSTWGGSCLRLGWVGVMMCMEMRLPTERVLTTTPVRSIRIVGSNKEWFYDLP